MGAREKIAAHIWGGRPDSTVPLPDQGGKGSDPEGEAARCNLEKGSVALLQEVHEDRINGCSEEVEEWEELEFLVDSGASAKVLGKAQVRAVQASEPDSSVHYRLANGSRIPNLGEKYFRAVTEECKALSA